jgi:hypothetical protein
MFKLACLVVLCAIVAVQCECKNPFFDLIDSKYYCFFFGTDEKPWEKAGEEDSHEEGNGFGKGHGGFGKQPPPFPPGKNGKGPSFRAGEGDNNDDGE